MCKQHHYQVVPKAKIPQQSAKQKEKNIEYLKVRMQYLSMYPNCQSCGAPATEVHHKALRRGDKLIDTNYFMSICRTCHDRIHNNPQWAEEKGYLIKNRHL